VDEEQTPAYGEEASDPVQKYVSGEFRGTNVPLIGERKRSELVMSRFGASSGKKQILLTFPEAVFEDWLESAVRKLQFFYNFLGLYLEFF
jgi:hypothetical protein